jgi:hypothetical protein
MLSSTNARACVVALCAAVSFSAAGLSFAATVVLPGPAPTTLDTLLVPGATYTVGDKQFSDFTYSYTGTNPDASGVNVIPIQDMDGNFGIRLQGGFVDLPGGGSSDSTVTFNVTALDLSLLISDAHLAANVALVGPGSASVTETFQPVFPNTLLMVFDTPGSTMLTDSAIFPGAVRTLPVQKHIRLSSEATSGPGFASMSFVDQTFSQIPEPSTLSLVGLVGFALAFRFRRK